MFYISREVTVGDIISIVVMIITFMGIFFTLKTLEEMKKQRISGVLPILNLKIPMDYCYKINKLSSKKKRNEFTLEIENIGNGPARNIDIKFSVNENLIDNCKFAKRDDNRVAIQYLHEKITLDDTFFYKKDISHKYQSLASLQSQQLHFDAKLRMIKEILIISFMESNGEKYFSKLFCIEISYEDVFGNKYKNTYEIGATVGRNDDEVMLFIEMKCVGDGTRIK